MAGGLLGIGTSALLSYQRALDTVSHNVANVNTEGYSRQRVELSARQPNGFGNGFAGNGVEVSSVQRLYDQYLTNEIRSRTATFKEMDVYQGLASRLDDLLTDENAGLSTVLNAFFDALQGAADDPASTVSRQVLLSEAGTLTARFHDLNHWMQDTREGLNGQLGTTLEEINALAGAIAASNQKIVDAQASAAGAPPNDLLDARDQLVASLSEYISVNAVTQDNGALNIFVGSGQALVLGFDHNQLDLQARTEDPAQFDIMLNSGGATTTNVTSLLSGGQLGGLLKFRDQLLDPAQNAIGRMAIELGSFMNVQHHDGITPVGLPGQDLFSVAVPQALPAAGNSGSVTVGFDDVAQLTTSDYQLRFNGSAWTLTRTGSGQVVPLAGSGTGTDPFTAEGLSIVIGAGAAAGDSYLIRPTRAGAGAINVALTNPGDLALAAPLRTSAALGNGGTGSITAGVVTDINNPAFQTIPGQLSPPVLIRFTSTTSYEVVDKATLTTIDTATYDPAVGADVFPTGNLGIDFGYQVRITGNPEAGDEFSVDYNSGGVGDNRNALLLAGLQVERLMDGGNTSFNDAYGGLVADVGTKTRQAQINSSAQQTILQQNEAQRASVSGVNLDEEAADLIRFQQAYQAAAQVIAVADTLFSALIDAVRR
jgi:flagellar hook-associated protein 1 FlgK